MKLIKKVEERKIKLTIDARMINASGIGGYIKNLLSYFANSDSYILYALILEKDKTLIPLGIEVIIFNSEIYSIKEQLLFPLKIPRCDIFWSPHYNIPILPIKAKKRFATVHDVYHIANFKDLTWLQKLYSKLVMNLCLTLSNRIITVSDFSKSEIKKYFTIKDNKIIVIHNGMKQETNLLPFEGIQKIYHLPKDYILFVGNVKPHKNLRRFLEAYDMLPQMLRDKYKVVIVGKRDGFLTGDKELKKWSDGGDFNNTNVIFTGFVTDEHMDTIIHYTNLFVFPSLYEGFGLPPLEAMVNQTATVTSSSACMPEICGDATLYFNPYSVNEIKEAIEIVLNDEITRKLLIDKGREHVKKFDWRNSFEKHNNLFLSI